MGITLMHRQMAVCGHIKVILHMSCAVVLGIASRVIVAARQGCIISQIIAVLILGFGLGAIATKPALAILRMCRFFNTRIRARIEP
jgi:large-conductance mechanosensitive channel